MEITRDEILLQLAACDQQDAQAVDGINNAERVKRDWQDKRQVVHGARQMLNHMLGILDSKTEDQNSQAGKNGRRPTAQ